MAFNYDAAERILELMGEDEEITLHVTPDDVVVLAFCVKLTADAIREQHDEALDESGAISILAIDAAWDSVMSGILAAAEERHAARN